MSESSLLTDQLRDKALLALEDAVQECRYRTPRPSFAVRFALAYLWVYGGRGDRRPYDELWKSLRATKSPWSFSGADHALAGIYRALQLDRPDEASWEMWRRWTAHEGSGGRNGPG
ncbi:MAG TPA: hypothetical protein VEC11_07730 [Allosphingosinicella sp.]|nr:hypothetical protein [Allosphingosinicella sp.]